MYQQLSEGVDGGGGGGKRFIDREAEAISLRRTTVHSWPRVFEQSGLQIIRIMSARQKCVSSPFDGNVVFAMSHSDMVTGYPRGKQTQVLFLDRVSAAGVYFQAGAVMLSLSRALSAQMPRALLKR